MLLGLSLAGAAAPAGKLAVVWGIELAPAKSSGPTDLARLHRQGLNALLLDPARMGAGERGRLTVSAHRLGMLVAVPRRGPSSSLAAWCRAERRSAAKSCTALVSSPRAAVALARRNVADFVVIRVSLAQLRFLQGVRANTHILAVVRLSARGVDRTAWARAVQSALRRIRPWT